MKAILTYHSIDDSGSVISTDPATFREHVKWLAAGAVRVTPLDEVLHLPSDADAVALTFDDGFENLGTIAAPLLADHGLVATAFVVTDHVGGTNAWGGIESSGIPTLRLLDWDGLGRLTELGVALGSHGRTHARLTTLSGAHLAEEVLRSADTVAAALGTRPTAFAYPYGSVSAEARSLVATAYRHACTTELRPLGDDDDPHLLPRLDMHYFREPRRLERWGTAEFRRRLWLRAQARRVRQQLVGFGRSHDA